MALYYTALSNQTTPFKIDQLSPKEVDCLLDHLRQELAQLSDQRPNVLSIFDALVEHFRSFYFEQNSLFPLTQCLDAISFAAQKHQGQTRKDFSATPYIIHPMGVALSLWEEASVRDPIVLIAALLHDTLEDTSATKGEIAAKFGIEVSEVVAELTKPPGFSTEQAKAWQIEHAPFLSRRAKLVKLADRLYNLRDLRNPPISWSEEKIQQYYGWGQALLDVLHGTEPTLERALQDEINAYWQGRLSLFLTL